MRSREVQEEQKVQEVQEEKEEQEDPEGHEGQEVVEERYLVEVLAGVGVLSHLKDRSLHTGALLGLLAC